jgi:hypothetical protein
LKTIINSSLNSYSLQEQETTNSNNPELKMQPLSLEKGENSRESFYKFSFLIVFLIPPSFFKFLMIFSIQPINLQNETVFILIQKSKTNMLHNVYDMWSCDCKEQFARTKCNEWISYRVLSDLTNSVADFMYFVWFFK